MRHLRNLLLPGALLMTVAGCANSQVAATGPGVRDTSVGRVLVDSAGMALYTYDKDSPNAPACTGLCAIAWPPAKSGRDARPSDGFSLVARPDGSRQWERNGHPLYAYIHDTRPGDVEGDGVGGVWHVARPRAGVGTTQ